MELDSRRFRLGSGDWVLVRPIGRADAQALAQAVEELSADARYRRFHAALPRLSDQMIDYLTDIDHHDHDALIATPLRSVENIVGAARFIRDPESPDTAEVAVAVLDTWQRRGLGTLLLRELAYRARNVGISTFTATILADNPAPLELARQLGDVETSTDGSTLTARMDSGKWLDDEPNARSLLRILFDANVVLVPRVLQGLLELSADLCHTLTVPVTMLLGPSPTGNTERDHDRQ